MSSQPTTRKRMRRVASLAALAPLATAALVLPFAGTALAGGPASIPATSLASSAAKTASNTTGKTVYNTTDARAAIVATTTPTTSNATILGSVVSGPDAASTVFCTKTPSGTNSIPNNTPNGEVVTLSAGQSECYYPIQGAAGTDIVRVFADNNGNGIFDSGDVAAPDRINTISGPGFSVTIPSSAQGATSTCVPLTVNLLDSAGRQTVDKVIKLNLSEAFTTQPAALAFGFCTPSGVATTPQTVTGSTTYTPGTSPATAGPGQVYTAPGATPGTTAAAQVSNGSSAIFGVTTDQPGSLIVTAFSGPGTTPTGADPSAVSTVTFTAGGANSVTNIALAPAATTVFPTQTESVVATLTNAAGAPVGGVPASFSVAGANPVAASNCTGTSNSLGQITCTTPATVNTGTDTMTVWVNKTPGTPALDAGETNATQVFTVKAPPTGDTVDLTAPGTVAGGTNAGTTDALQENSVQSTSATTEVFTAIVKANTAGTPVQAGVGVDFTLTQPAGKTGYLGSTPGTTTAHGVTDANGKATVTITRDSNATGSNRYLLTAQITGLAACGNETLGDGTDAGAECATDFGSADFQAPAAKTIVIAPVLVTTQVGTAQTFTSTLTDQFGTPVAGQSVTFSVSASGRGNTAVAPKIVNTDANGQATYTYTDLGSTSSAAGTDTVTVSTSATGTSTANATRTYTLTAPTAAAIEGAFAANEQFSGTNGSVAKTDDDTTSQQVSYTAATVAARTPVTAYFEVRNADGSSRLPGKSFSITSTGVGTLVDATNAPLTNPQVVTSAGSPPFASIKALSTATGVQTITATVDGLSKSITITWTAGVARAISLAPATKTVVVGDKTLMVATVVDAFGNGVPNMNVFFTSSSNGSFGNGSNSISSTTDGTGVASVLLSNNSAGTDTVTAQIFECATPGCATEEYSKAANVPFQGARAGSSSATSTITVSATPIGDPTKTTLLLSPSTQQFVNNVVTATGTVHDASGNPVVGQGVRFSITGVTSAISGILTTDSNGQAAYPFTSSNAGVAHVLMDVVSSGGVSQFTKTADVTFVNPTVGKPVLSQTNSHGLFTMTVHTDPSFEGKTIYFFAQSGISGKVLPLGTGVVDHNGIATRSVNGRSGQIYYIYGHLLGVSPSILPDSYTNNVAFRMNTF